MGKRGFGKMGKRGFYHFVKSEKSFMGGFLKRGNRDF